MLCFYKKHPNFDLKAHSIVHSLYMLRSQCTHRFDSVSNAHNQLPILLHLVDKLHGQHAAVKCLAELLCCSIQSTSKAITLRSDNKENKTCS